jgi:hypothetical protein
MGCGCGCGCGMGCASACNARALAVGASAAHDTRRAPWCTPSPSSRCGSHSMARSYNSIPHTITLIRSTPERPSTPLIRGDCVARVLLLHSMLPQRHHEHSTVATHTHTRTHTHTHTHTHNEPHTHTHTVHAERLHGACRTAVSTPSRTPSGVGGGRRRRAIVECIP